jgi:predicted DNA-binding transcriptional regulator AlpA
MTLRENEIAGQHRVGRKHKKPSEREAERRRQQSANDRQSEREQHRDRVLTFRMWCEVNSFSLATGRRVLKSGHGPPVLQLSPRRIGIRESDNRAWQASRAR